MSSVPHPHQPSFHLRRALLVLSTAYCATILVLVVGALHRASGLWDMIVIALAIVSVLLRLSYWADREYAIIIYFASGAFFISIFNVALWWGGRPPSHPSIALVEILALTGMSELTPKSLTN